MHTLDYNTYPGILTLPASKYGQILVISHKNLLQKHKYPARKQDIHKKTARCRCTVPFPASVYLPACINSRARA